MQKVIGYYPVVNKEDAEWCGYRIGNVSLQMLEILKGGEYDSVAARRVSRTGEPVIRSWCARKFYQLINRISDADIVDGARDL